MNPQLRRRLWETRYPDMKGWKIVRRGLTGQQAQALQHRIAANGQCDSRPFEAETPGRWSVYHFYYYSWVPEHKIP